MLVAAALCVVRSLCALRGGAKGILLEEEIVRVKPKVHMLFHCVEFVRQYHALGRYGEAPIESCHHDVHFTFENHGNSGGNLVSKQRRLHSDIVQRRVSRVESESIVLPPTPRLCPQCGQPWARYLNGGHVHVCA